MSTIQVVSNLISIKRHLVCFTKKKTKWTSTLSLANLGLAGKSAKLKVLCKTMVLFKSLRLRYHKKRSEPPFGISCNQNAYYMTLRLMNTIYTRGKAVKGRKAQILARKVLVIAIFRCEVH